MKLDENSYYFMSLKELRKFFMIEQNQSFENDEDLKEVIRTYEEKSQAFDNEKTNDKIWVFFIDLWFFYRLMFFFWGTIIIIGYDTAPEWLLYQILT